MSDQPSRALRPRRRRKKRPPQPWLAPLLSLLLVLVLLGSFALSIPGVPATDVRRTSSRQQQTASEPSNLLPAHHRLHHAGGGAASASAWTTRPRSAAELVLADIVLVSTVEGGLLGLNRRTGRKMWSLGPGSSPNPRTRRSGDGSGGDGDADDKENTRDAPPLRFGPLVDTTYGPAHRSFAHLAAGLPLLDDMDSSSRPNPSGDEAIETLRDDIGLYVVEPSSAGEVYVLAATAASKRADDAAKYPTDMPPSRSPPHPSHASSLEGTGTTLQRFPLTLPQLVALSPFSFPGDDDKVFVAHKSTSLIELDLATGRIGAVFGASGAAAGVHASGGAQHDEEGAGAEGPSGQPRGNWTHIGRTDYTLTIHSRRYPDLSQTLRHSTFTPNAADQDVAELWNLASSRDVDQRLRELRRHRREGSDDAAVAVGLDERSIQPLPDERSVVCFNLSRAGQNNDRNAPWAVDRAAEERMLWRSHVGGNVAGVYDVVQPAPHLVSPEVHPRPVIVPHKPLPLDAIFGASAAATALAPRRRAPLAHEVGGDGSELGGAGGSSGFATAGRTAEHAYLGISDGSLFALGGSHFPLVSLSSPALAGLPGPARRDVDGATRHPSWNRHHRHHYHADGGVVRGGLARDGAEDQSPSAAVPPPPPRACTSYGCWIGSYDVEVDGEAESEARRRLLLLGVGGTPPHGLLGIDGRPEYPTLDGGSPDNDGAVGGGVGGRGDANDRGSTPTPLQGEERRPTPVGPFVGHPPSDSGRHGSAPQSTSATAAAVAWWQWRPTPTMALAQLIAVLGFGILLALIYIGLQEQRRQSREAASAIAKEVVWVPALVDEKSGEARVPEVGGDESGEKAKDVQPHEGVGGVGVSTAKASAANGSYPQNTQSGEAATAAFAGATKKPVEELLEAEQQAGAAASSARAEKRKAGKRRRRGKRAGVAQAVRDAKKAASNAGGGGLEADGGEGEYDDGEGEEGEDEGDDKYDDDGDQKSKGDGGSRREHTRSSSSKSSMSALQTGRKEVASSEAGAAHSLETDALVRQGWMQTTEPSVDPRRQREQHDELVRRAAHASELEEAKERKQSGGVIRKGQSLIISDEVLGFGSSGTVVFKGTFQGRAVAVKRLLRDFVSVASKEVSLLESADNHPNVIRYFYKELTSSFLYIALELCPASLADVVERPAEHRELSNLLEPKRALMQIASGLRHLHSLSIVHRDIKPQNVLVTHSRGGGRLKMLLSDFGLSKKLDGVAASSFSQTMNNPGGTVGWRAPEILRGDVSLEEATANGGGGGSGSGSTPATDDSEGSRKQGGAAQEKMRLTRAVDIFALGCLAYYTLSNGDHPFGSRFEREMNVVRGRYELAALEALGEEGVEAAQLVAGMIDAEARRRPSAVEVLAHPYFWDAQRRLAFLQDASDRFEAMEREPPDPTLVRLEADAAAVVGGGGDWLKRVDRLVSSSESTASGGKRFRSYDGRSVQHLLRFVRNKKHHWQELPSAARKMVGDVPQGFLHYFTSRFPRLFLHTYAVVAETPRLRVEPLFSAYFEPLDQDA